MGLAVCITTYNEAESIGWIVHRFSRFGFPVYVVDDRSADDTFIQAAQAGAKEVHGTSGGWGIGPSLLYAWRMALSDPECTGILQIDAGGSHSVEDVPTLIYPFSFEGADLVIGSRFCPGASYIGNPKRYYLSRLAATMCNVVQGGAHWSDWTSGYRVFSRCCLEYLLTKQYEAKMHGWQIEVLAHAGARGFTIVEVPITYIAGKSSFNRHVADEAFHSWLHVMHHVGWVGSKLDE